MIFHYAQVCQFVIMTSEATTAQLIKYIKNHLMFVVIVERLPHTVHEKGYIYF